MYNTKSLPRGSHGCESDKVRLHREQQQQSTPQFSTNSLPKSHQQQPVSQHIYGKVTNPSRSVLNDVVNKVPSVIMIPQESGQMLKNVSMAPKAKLASSKNSSSSDSYETESNECHNQNNTLKRSKSKKEFLNANEKLISSKVSTSSSQTLNPDNSRCEAIVEKRLEKPLPVLTTIKNCTNAKEHFLPSETSLDDDYLSECENCKTAGTGSRYYLDGEELDELPLQETMTLQRKLMNENDESDQQTYYRVSSTLPSNTNKKIP